MKDKSRLLFWKHLRSADDLREKRYVEQVAGPLGDAIGSSDRLNFYCV